MSRFLRIVTFALLAFLAAGAAFAQEAQDAQPKAAWPAYAYSLLLGFGSGQYYLGTNGTPFLIGDLIGVGAWIGGGIFALSARSTTDAQAAISSTVTGSVFIIVGSLVYLVSHVWEIIDVFRAVDSAQRAGRVVEIVPVVDVRTTAWELGVSLRF
jgi:hypothetical protein